MTSYPCSSKRWRGWPCTASVSVPAAVVASRWHKWTVWCCQFVWAGTQWLSKVSFSSPGSRGHVALRAARKTQILTSPRAFLKNAWLISYNYTAALKEALKLFQLGGFQHVWNPDNLLSKRSEFLIPSQPPIPRTTCPSESSVHLLHHFPFLLALLWSSLVQRGLLALALLPASLHAGPSVCRMWQTGIRRGRKSSHPAHR